MHHNLNNMWSDSPCSLEVSHKYSICRCQIFSTKSHPQSTVAHQVQGFCRARGLWWAGLPSMHLPARSPFCFFGCPAPQVVSILPITNQTRSACPWAAPNVVYNIVATAITCNPDVDFASLVSGKMLKMVCFHVSGTSPVKSAQL